MKYILSYDLGTGGTKASLYDETGKSVAFAFVSCDTLYPRPDFREQRPSDWWASVVDSTRELIAKTSVDIVDIVGIALSGHSLGVVPVDAAGTLLIDQVPIWSDARAVKQAETFFATEDYAKWYNTTGSGFPPHLYAAFKILWYKDNMPELYRDAQCFLGTKDYINFLLTGVKCTDFSYASGSGVHSLTDWGYSPYYLEKSGIDGAKLPEIVPSTQVIGTLLPEVAKTLGLSASTQVVCGGVDNACMALGAGCFEDGAPYLSLGTSAWIAVSGKQPVLNLARKPYVFAHCVPGMYVSATAIFSAGNSFRWMRDNLCAGMGYDEMDELAKQSPPGCKGLMFCPSLAGGSGLDDTPNVRGAFTGLDLGHTRGDLIRASLEGICLNLRFALDVLGENTVIADEMLMVGGGGKSDFWRGLFADIFEKTMTTSSIGEDAGAFGAAALGAVGCGLWKDFSPVKTANAVTDRMLPNLNNVTKYREIYAVYREMLKLQYPLGDKVAEMLKKSNLET